ncbi:serine acetyltransferase [Dyadobacter luteus]|uniref:Serine acetyltransferase n=1 Tax=Dyadobacter luteus TaxID=2259619 RepID=A0A3D8YE83_9BACT|nr:serine acetyltransferase [Dyadobacter luteus]REA62495.1 serine acetyltransferase [Dyadobacter luteus]
MNTATKADLFRHSGKISLGKFLFCLIRIPGFRFIYLWRKAKRYSKYNPLGLLFKLLYIHFAYKYGFQIPLHVQIGSGFYIGHFGTIIINRSAVIGNNCNIAPNVTIGQTNKGDKKGVPHIGNEVWIGTGTVIVGKIKIGNNVLIAPNSFINSDVPSNSLVMGNPATVIPKSKDITDDYVINIFGEGKLK